MITLKNRFGRAGSRAVAIAVAALTLATGAPLAAQAADSAPLDLLYFPDGVTGVSIAGIDLPVDTGLKLSSTYTPGVSPALSLPLADTDFRANEVLVPEGGDPRNTSDWVAHQSIGNDWLKTADGWLPYVGGSGDLGISAWLPASVKAAGGSYVLAVIWTDLSDQPQDRYPGAWAVPITIEPGGATFRAQGTAPVLTAPAVPAAPTVTAGADSLDVSWVAPVDGGSPITGYTAHLYSGGAEVTSLEATGTSATFAGLTQETAYEVGIVATNAVGTSPESARTSVTTSVPGQRDVVAEVPEPAVDAVDGQLVLDVPAGSANLGTAVQQADNSFDASGALGRVTVDDQRAVTKKGWTVTAQVSDFTGGRALSQAQLGWTPAVTSGGTSTSTGVQVGLAQAAGAGTAVRTFAEAPAGSGVGVTNLDAALTFKAPAGTPKGTYTAKVVITATSK